MTPLTKDFLTAGCAIFTVEPSAHFKQAMAQQAKEFEEHYTYRIENAEFEEGRSMFFVQALTGPDNTSDYSYVGALHPTQGSIRFTRKSAFHPTATRVECTKVEPSSGSKEPLEVGAVLSGSKFRAAKK